MNTPTRTLRSCLYLPCLFTLWIFLVGNFLAAAPAHLRYAEQSRGVYDLTEQAGGKRDRQLLDQAAQVARQAETQFRAAAQADPDYVDLDLPPRPLDRFLRSAQAAGGASAKKRPSRRVP